MFNYIFKFFSWADSTFTGWFRRIWIHRPRQCLFIFSLLTIIVILFYGSIKFGFVFDEGPKFNSSSFYLWDGLLEFREKAFIRPRTSNGVDTFKGVKDFASKSGSGIIEFFSFLLFARDYTCKEGGEQCHEEDAENPIYSFLHYYLPIFLGTGLTWFIVLISLTQRKNQPERSGRLYWLVGQ